MHPGRHGFGTRAACHCSGTLSTRSAARRFAVRVLGRLPGNPVRNAVAWPESVLLGMVHDGGIGEVRGYARCAVEPAWDAAGPRGTVRVRQVEALDPVVYAALWGFLFGIDLTSSVAVAGRPVDDALPHLVADNAAVRDRAAGVAVRAAGGGRRGAGGAGAACVRASDPAELALSVREMGSALLGGFSLTSLAVAGRGGELRPGAPAAASVAFGSDAAPWLPDGF
ncbi:sterol carrier protein domain-containing protein [Streptomyces lydicus]|uniref:sterol carrier protein domain-containing protein n=1 Tax=Streptomyces lydicus TaxID=47763 RepID=UPI0036F8A0C9